MPVELNRLTSISRELRSEPCEVEARGRENRAWREQHAGKREVPRQWFIPYAWGPPSSGWIVTKRRNLGWGTALSGSGSPVQSGILKAIASSRWILDLEDDWDEAGASSYARSTWDRACQFLIQQAVFCHEVFGKELPSPKILPGPDASIDLHWKRERFELLVNIPSDLTKLATFYGDDRGSVSIRGSLNPSGAVQGLVGWLLA